MTEGRDWHGGLFFGAEPLPSVEGGYTPVGGTPSTSKMAYFDGVSLLCSYGHEGVDVSGIPLEIPFLLPASLAAILPPGESNSEEVEGESSAQAKVTLTWIGIELLDASGFIMAGVKYEVTDSTGRIRRGVLDETGKAWVYPVAEGPCEVVFPDIDSP